MNFAQLSQFLSDQPLLLLAVAAILFASVGWMLQHNSPRAAHGLRIAGYSGMVTAALLTVVEATWLASRSDIRLATGRVGEVQVRGTQTVVPLDPGGHYWVKAQLNGTEQDLMIDTGATYTAISAATARSAGVVVDSSRMPVQLDTANGPMVARFGKVDDLRFGSIFARSLDVVIAPDSSGDINVIGMNLLLRLESWRVENKSLVLVPGITEPDR